jgi:2-polyprenyl-6-methoxyphenol hydroxylase-like FAD-dependent oxidoreductase
METYDCVIVGARCAGSPLATLLARQGARVAVVEQAAFPRETLSTHLIHAQALAFLDRLGVMKQVRATGAPLVGRFDTRQEDLEYSTPIPQRQGDVGGFMSVRRSLLDPILAQAAVEAGADLHMASKVTGLVEDRGRVTGVRVAQNGSQTTLRARLVIGADGRNSTVASLAGARKYNLTSNERFVYWSFFEAAEPGADPASILHHWGARIVIANPADSGLYQVIVAPDLSELPRFRADLEGSFMEYARSCRPVARALANARRVGKIFGMLRWEGFFREACGPGWVLVGDAGHFKDPMPGQGMQDAFRQVDALASAIVENLDGSAADVDRALRAWGRWRDEDAAEHYWFATDMGKAGALDSVVPEIQGRLLAQGKIDILTNLFTHRSRPSQVFTPPRLLAATGRLLVRPGCQRRKLLREVRALAAQDVRRKRLERRPVYAAAGTALDAGATEVEESSASSAHPGGRGDPAFSS